MTPDNNLPALSVRDVSVSYGTHAVVRNLSLDVRSGETFGLIGLNGVGKTTLIKSILGLRDHQSGIIEIAGHDRFHPDSRRKLAYLPERFDPAWFLKGVEFLRFSVSFYGLPFDEAVAHLYCRKLALDPSVLGSKIQTYSKGMRQKLGLIGTLLTKCPLLILDEPMSGLDPQARSMVKDTLQVARTEGQTIFFSSHILADMNEICDRVGVLHGGKIIYCGTPAGLIAAGGNANIERAFLNLIAMDGSGQRAA
ncbi:MAG TPA: ABC transporter ATP-binding protein [Patescibacteria group bacterium]|jgi:ABC-2 type transport system ATP-binding protein|nr:ABC transporter ATP-binding protein [Patescibacteria group bacterium]